MNRALFVLTGILAASPLPAQDRIPVWIDTDPSIARGGIEVDDGFALVQAFHSPEIAIRGVSVVFGNTTLAKAMPIAQEAVERFGPEGLLVHEGAAGAADLGRETAGTRALAEALRTEPLIVLALGPVTNVATVLKNHPELAPNVRRVVVVAGRRPGQRFLTKPDSPPHRDFNFELDAEGFQVLLESGVSLVMAPWEISSKVWLTLDDMENLHGATPAAEWLYGPGMDWIARWQTMFDVSAFNPYDTLAVAYVTSPEWIRCEEVKAAIQTLPNDRIDFMPDEPSTKPYLLAAADLPSGHAALYCATSAPAFKDDLMRRLLAR